MSTNFGCAICCSVFSQANINSRDRLPVALPTCGHSFHIDCVKTWFETSRTCPICRTAGNSIDLMSLNLHVKKISSSLSRLSFNPEEHQETKKLNDELTELRGKMEREKTRLKKIEHYVKDVHRSIRHVFVEMEDNIPVIDLSESFLNDSLNSVAAPSTSTNSSLPRFSSTSTNNNLPRASLPPQPRAAQSVPPLIRSTSSASIPARALSSSRHVHVRVGASGSYTTIVTDRRPKPPTRSSTRMASTSAPPPNTSSTRLTNRAPFRNV